MAASRGWAASIFCNCTRPLPQVLGSSDLARAWEYAATLGITAIGASVSDLASAEIAIAGAAYGILQFPYNVAQQTFADVLDRAAARGMKIAINRPFGMGRMLYENRELTKAGAFAFILEKTLRRRHPERHEIARSPGRELARLRRSARPPRPKDACPMNADKHEPFDRVYRRSSGCKPHSAASPPHSASNMREYSAEAYSANRKFAGGKLWYGSDSM